MDTHYTLKYAKWRYKIHRKRYLLDLTPSEKFQHPEH